MASDKLILGFLKVVEDHYKIRGGYLYDQWGKYKEKYEKKKVAKNKKSIPDNQQEVLEYMKSLKIVSPNENSERFYNHYKANGWVQGKGAKPIVDWKACVKTWSFEKEGNAKSGISIRRYKENNK